ncbi:MAG: heavy-metal-associated domain-containing protein [Phenylobacterium sp.]|uniref:heavy-metal-associated domain-containing protein n=1 Tax=Phenylobacterium sp. TaxID=1871053 RepID=UPI00271AF72D|nr:heavy-metal-associated domain-containing protein [Phenylobacterium sp.]MDO8410913.1 heavy-metal-associated domain-containing protein [Phenylobacterium sp.]
MLLYHVKDLSCGHCVQAVTAAINALDPAADIAIDLASKRVEVRSDREPSAVATAISKAGYTPALYPQDAAAATSSGSCCCGSRR